MKKEQKILIMKERLNRMENLKTEVNIKCPGVRKKLMRQLRNAGVEV